MDRDHLRRACNDGDRREILDRVIGQVGVGHRGDREIVGHHQQRVTVRRGLRDLSRADRAARAGDVFDDERLPETLTELLRKQARDQVGRTAGRIGHDDADLLGRIAALSLLGG